MEKQFGRLVRGVRRDRRPAAGLAAAHLRRRARSATRSAARPASSASTTASSCPAAPPTWPASGRRPASPRSPRAPRASRSSCRRRWPPACPSSSLDSPSGPREIIQHEVNGLLVAPGSVAGTGHRAAPARHRRRPAPPPRCGRARVLAAVRRPRRSPSSGSRIFADARARRGGSAGSRPGHRARGATGAGRRHSITGVTPAQARTATLAAAADIARAVSDEWFVIPAHEAAEPTVVLPMDARDAFLARLAEADAAGVPLARATRRPTAGPSAAGRSPTSRPTCAAAGAAGWSWSRGPRRPSVLGAGLRRGRASSGRPASTATWSRPGPTATPAGCRAAPPPSTPRSRACSCARCR